MCAFHNVMRSALIIFASALAGCGGGAGGGGTTAGIGGTGQIASGTITAFGSVFVNGIEFFDIDTATCIIDGNDSTGTNCQSNLELGMVVKVTGAVNGAQGNATQIVYDDDIDGPITGILPLTPGPADVTRTFTIFGIPVLIDSATTTFSGSKDFNTLTNNDVVELSGFFDNSGVLHATYAKFRGTLALGTTTVEIHGTVSGTTPAGGASNGGDTFTVNGITVTIQPGADLSDMPGGTVSNGDLVEVRGILQSSTAIDADRIEPEDANIGSDGDEASIEGLVTHFTGNLNGFRVDGQRVDASTATLEPGSLQIDNGVKVEVEGTISGSTLIATRVEARGNDIKLEATVSAKDASANTVTLQFASGDTVTVQLNNQTQMEDRTGAATNMMLSHINIGDFLEIRGFLSTDPMVPVVASEIRRNSIDDDILEAPVDSFVPDTSFTLLGVSFGTDSNTSFEDETGSLTRSGFYAKLATGCVVKVQDDNAPPPDGVADEVELESCP